jgi:hypothetical protein
MDILFPIVTAGVAAMCIAPKTATSSCTLQDVLRSVLGWSIMVLLGASVMYLTYTTHGVKKITEDLYAVVGALI